ncbi:hypothetical protein M9H77_06941 [Catharanthus roseus]|uniref:Uncharacterized protein n=1 Tax=Catharanthus roseus TaxID=4058 RepID=A0ACC0BTI5_CATRO|nr:hypothetical protein M9H77_06941 [Catharanthus roseus]
MHTRSSANKDTLKFIHNIDAFALSHRKRKSEVIYKVTNSSEEGYSSESESENPKMANPMTLKDYTKPKIEGFNPAINCPAITTATFKIEPTYIQMLSRVSACLLALNYKSKTKAKPRATLRAAHCASVRPESLSEKNMTWKIVSANAHVTVGLHGQSPDPKTRSSELSSGIS